MGVWSNKEILMPWKERRLRYPGMISLPLLGKLGQMLGARC